MGSIDPFIGHLSWISHKLKTCDPWSYLRKRITYN